MVRHAHPAAITHEGAAFLRPPKVPDLASQHSRAPRGADWDRCHIGDGASISRPLVRRRGKTLIGHASVREQLDWCRAERVERVVVTHCGSQIVAGQSDSVEAKISALARDRGITINIAVTGWRRRSDAPAFTSDPEWIAELSDCR